MSSASSSSSCTSCTSSTSDLLQEALARQLLALKKAYKKFYSVGSMAKKNTLHQMSKTEF